MFTHNPWFRLDRHDGEPTDQGGDEGGKPADTKLPQFTGDFDPDRAARALAAAREAEKAAKAQAQEAVARAQEKEEQLAKVLKALGKTSDADEPPDPAELTAQIEAAQSAAWRSSVELQVHRIAGKLGGDPDRMLDSMSFIDTLDELVDADPASADFRTQVEAKVREAIDRNPTFKAGSSGPRNPAPDQSQGRGGNTDGPVDFRKASKEQVAAELAKYGIRRYS